MIRDHGSERRYYHDLIGFNGRLDEIQAVVLRAKLPHLEEWNEAAAGARRPRYNELLQDAPIVTPVEMPENKHVYHLYVIRAPRRDELQAWLKSQGVSTGIHYPVPIHLQNAMSFLGYKAGDLPVTERVVEEALSLPMYPELADEEIEFVADRIKAFYGESS